MEATSRLVGADYVAAKLDVSKPTAYRIIRLLNSELVAAGARVSPIASIWSIWRTAYFTQPEKGGASARAVLKCG